MIDLSGFIQQLLQHRPGGICYKKPDAEALICLLPKEVYGGEDFPVHDKGFLIHPFLKHEEAYFLPFKEATVSYYKFTSPHRIKPTSLHLNPDTIARKQHLKLVQEGVEFIRRGNANKIVLSHRFEISSSQLNIQKVFTNLLTGYPEAFVYLWKHPNGSLWLGATPEQLIEIQGNKYQTMALAGTLENPDGQWTQKEYDEHLWVVDYLKQKLAPFSSEVIQEKTGEVQAGHLKHLQTLLHGRLIPGTPPSKIVNKLHPTPAVCGTPTGVARKFILDHEGYPREFYTGFLGEWNPVGNTNLYVNLRCMQVNDNKLYLYAGGGITEESYPEQEWDEIIRKAEIMSRMLVF